MLPKIISTGLSVLVPRGKAGSSVRGAVIYGTAGTRKSEFFR